MGKNKYIETPDLLWELFTEYKTTTKANPRLKHVFVGKDGNSDYEELERPLTIEGFENYVFEKGVINDLGDYFKNKDGRYSDYAPICSRIKQRIRQDQIEGGMVGQYNASITQRLNNLTEKLENTNLNKEVPLFPDVQENDRN
jgi:hypothetical protein